MAVRIDMPMPGLEIRMGNTAPPQMRHEHRSSSPGPGYVWASGSWDWRGNDWGWVPGRWDRPGSHNVQWVKAQYAREGPAWRYEPAHWSNQHVVEGNEYRSWKAQNHGNRGDNGNYKHGHDKN